MTSKQLFEAMQVEFMNFVIANFIDTNLGLWIFLRASHGSWSDIHVMQAWRTTKANKYLVEIPTEDLVIVNVMQLGFSIHVRGRHGFLIANVLCKFITPCPIPNK